MKPQTLSLLITLIASSACLAQVVPVSAESVGLIPKTATFDVNTNFNNTSTESLGVGIAANGNVLAAWEDDGSGISDTENIYSLFSSTGTLLTTPITITDYMGNTLADVPYRAFYRDNGTPTPGNVSWGPKVHANLFGNGYGIGGNAFVNDTPFLYGMGFEIPRFADIQVDDAGNGAGDFPAVQLLNNDGTPAALALSGVTDANSEPAGSIRLGDWEYLSNGNIVIVGESRQADDQALTGQTSGNVIVFRIVTAAGAEVKGYTAVSSSSVGASMWHGVGVTSNGFAVRFDAGGVQVRMFDNSGNPTTTNIDLSALTGVAHGGRGDAAGFHGNGKDAYLDVTTANPGTGNTPWITVLNTDGTLRYSRAVADTGDPNPVADRVDGAISADGRVIAVWDDNSVTGFRLPQGRILSKTGDGLGGIFWISERDDSTNSTVECRRPRAAWRGDNVAIVWESKNSPVSVDNVVSVRLFSPPSPLIPGGAASVGLTHIVPDTLVWFSASQAKPMVGGFVVGDDVANGGSVEATAGLLGDSTFLLAACMKADDGVSMRFTTVYQPATGGVPKLGDLFYDDSGVPYTNKINESRQDGNPGRIAGDPRVGGVNIIGAGEVSLWAYPTFFNSDGRFDVAKPFYAYMATGNARDACVQTFSLNPATLSQTMLGKAQDSAFGGLSGSTPGAGASADQLSRTGGTVAGLDNGNFVSVVEDRSRLFNPDGNASVATIFAPNGSVVKAAFKVADADQWSNVGAFKGGFYVRPSGGLIYFYDNAGNLQGSLNHNDTSGIAFDTGRGDGTRTASDIRSHYVFMAGNAGTPSQTWLAVFDANTREFVTKATVSDTDPALHALDRVNVAVDALNRACVTFRLRPIAADFSNSQVAARVVKFDGTNITYLTHSFFPFLNHDEVPGANNFITQESSVAMTTREIFIYAEGTVNSTNNPAGAADTAAQTHVYTVISHPDPQPTPGAVELVITSITPVGQAVTITWTGGTGQYLLQKKFNLNDTNWLSVLTTPDKSATVALQGAASFFRVVDGAQTTVIPLTAFLSGDAERPTPNASTATGLGSFSLEGNTLNYYITFSGLSANASAAHIHGPTNTTAAAGVIIPFSPPAATSGVISGSVTVSDLFKGYLLSGLTYANIHDTPNFGGGEIRGQIGPSQLKVSLNAANEPPPPTVVSSGTGSGVLTRVGNQLFYNISYSGLTSAATAGHIHGPAPLGVNANVVFPFSGVSGTSGTLSGNGMLSATALAAIADGLAYVNIHTVNFGGGEIRGQITP